MSVGQYSGQFAAKNEFDCTKLKMTTSGGANGTNLSKLHFHFSATETAKQVLVMGGWVVKKPRFFIIHHDSHHYSHTALWWDTASSSCAYQYQIACRIPVLWRSQALKVLLPSMTKQIELGQFIDHKWLAPLSLQALNCRNLINDLVHF